MKILAIDTTREFGSLALAESGRLIEEVLLHSPDGFSPILFDRVRRLLDAHDCAVDRIDCFAAASGPGSFTGVRVGLAAIKGLAEALNKPAVAVSNLKALATFGTAPVRAVVLDARRGEIYGAVYGSDLKVLDPEMVSKFPAWLERLPEGVLEFIALDFTPYRGTLAGTRFAQAPVIEAPRAQAAAIAKIAWQRLTANQAQDPAALDANYVRRSDAELFWKDQ